MRAVCSNETGVLDVDKQTRAVYKEFLAAYDDKNWDLAIRISWSNPDLFPECDPNETPMQTWYWWARKKLEYVEPRWYRPSFLDHPESKLGQGS